MRNTVIEALVGNILMSRVYENNNSIIYGNSGLIDNVRIHKPVIVLGMPRSGTTFLFNMLNVDNRMRATLNYEGTW